jgi:hypothetical protein
MKIPSLKRNRGVPVHTFDKSQLDTEHNIVFITWNHARCLYIGTTGQPLLVRLHALRSTMWIKEATAITFEDYPTWDEATKKRDEYVAQYDPAYTSHGKKGATND